MTDTTPEPAIADVLTKKQQRRMYAMTASKELLTLPASAGGVFTSSTSRPAVDTGDYVDAIIQLSDYMIHGTQRAQVEPVRGIGFGIPIGLIDDLFAGGGDESEAEPEASDEAEPKPEAIATRYELVRHAEKQGVSYADAYRYFERAGYDMTEVADFEFDQRNPSNTAEEN